MALLETLKNADKFLVTLGRLDLKLLEIEIVDFFYTRLSDALSKKEELSSASAPPRIHRSGRRSLRHFIKHIRICAVFWRTYRALLRNNQ